jgi:hypothetical protein
MKHPQAVIHQHCQHHGVTPIELLAYLIKCLQQFHMFRSGFAAQGAAASSSVYEEIESVRGMFTPPAAVPASLLAALDLAASIQHLMDRENAKGAKSRGDPSYPHMEREANAGETLRCVLRDIMNDAEHYGLDRRLALEQREKDEGGDKKERPRG